MTDIKSLLREAGQFIIADEKTMDLLPKEFHANPDAYIRSLAAQLEAAAESMGEMPLFSGKEVSLSGNTSREGRDCKHGHLARACEICDLEAKLAAAVADAAAEREKVRVLRGAMNRIIDRAGSLDSARLMCDKALAATTPEGGEG